MGFEENEPVCKFELDYVKQDIQELQQQLESLLPIYNWLIGGFSLPFQLLTPDSKLPIKLGKDEACYDFACVADKNFKVRCPRCGGTFPLPWNDEGCLMVDSDITTCYDCMHEGRRSTFGPFTHKLEPGASYVFKLGIASAIPKNMGMFLWDRSGMGAKKKIHRLAGVIDSTYRGEWAVCLVNHSRMQSHLITEGDRIVQGHLALILPGNPIAVDSLPDTYRGGQGFGSTGN